MKLLAQVSALFTIGMMATSAMAETGSGYERLQEGGRQRATLDHCEGYVQLSQTYVAGKKLPLLQIRDVTNCSVVLVDGVKQSDKLERNGRFGSLDKVIFETAGRNIHRVTLQSSSGATSDTIEVVSFGSQAPTPNPGANIVFNFGGWSTVFGGEQTKRMYECGGEVSARLEHGDTLTLVFRDVKSCSKFDILSSDGSSVNYPQKSMQKTRAGEYSGSFTVPKRFVDAGRNSIKVVVKSNSGAHDEVILVKFAAY